MTAAGVDPAGVPADRIAADRVTAAGVDPVGVPGDRVPRDRVTGAGVYPVGVPGDRVPRDRVTGACVYPGGVPRNPRFFHSSTIISINPPRSSQIVSAPPDEDISRGKIYRSTYLSRRLVDSVPGCGYATPRPVGIAQSRISESYGLGSGIVPGH